jgi:hypothetical protein
MTTPKSKPEPAKPVEKTEHAPPLRRRDATGHLDPNYEAKLRGETGHSRSEDDARAFMTRAKSSDAFAEELGEEFVETATSGEDEAEDVFNQTVPEDAGGPFVETSGKQEFAHGTDASNIKGATREPFPKT